MRLIDTETGELKLFDRYDGIKYAILSHRWEEDEVSFQDMASPNVSQKKGYKKIRSACAEALRAGLPYMWIDTCCIDKTSSAELSEAINSMYKWYKDAVVCYAYLSDVEGLRDLQQSLWFTRGWTLQELLAPRYIRFYDKHWRYFGTKQGMQAQLSALTGIPTRVLRGDDDPSVISIAQRMFWAGSRMTTRTEDQAYCLMGLFDVNMPLLYGEGSKAFIRLQEEIIKTSDDHSIFAWTSPHPGRRGILADSPAYFRSSAHTKSIAESSEAEQYSITNVGLSIRLPIIPWAMNVYMAILQCHNRDALAESLLMPHARQESMNMRLGILITRTNRYKQFVRLAVDHVDLCEIDLLRYGKYMKPVDLLISRFSEPLEDPNQLYGFAVRNLSTVLFANYKTTSQKAAISDVWSSKRYHDLRKWDPEIKGFAMLNDEQPIKIFEMSPGTQGNTVHFEFAPRPYNKEPDRGRGARDVGAISFGFDFDFNPVCIIYRSDAFLESPLRQDPTGQPLTCRALEDIVSLYRGRPVVETWAEDGMCVLKGDKSGLRAELPMLNVQVEICEQWRSGTDKAWFVDINAMELPYVRYDSGRERRLRLESLIRDQKEKKEQARREGWPAKEVAEIEQELKRLEEALAQCTY